MKSSFSKVIVDFVYRCKWKCFSVSSYEIYDKGRVGEIVECGEESVRFRDWSYKVKLINLSFWVYNVCYDLLIVIDEICFFLL